MARRYNTAAIVSDRAASAAVGDTPTWVSFWDADSGGNFLRSLPMSQTVSALALGERVEFPAEMLALVKSPSAGSLVAGVLMTNAGTGYTSAPAVGFTGGGGSGAAGTAIVQSQQIVRVVITNPGAGYTSVPTVSFTGGAGSSAAGTALLSGRETERTAAAALAGETASDMWLQFHDGDPGAAGTNNVVQIARVQQASTNWTAAAT